MKTKPKTASELNGIIAKHLDILDSSKVTKEAVKIALAVSTLIGIQIKNENKLINYEYLRLHGGRVIKELETA
jgi:hypothetical protein